MLFETISETALEFGKKALVGAVVGALGGGWPVVIGAAIITMGIDATLDSYAVKVTKQKEATFTELASDKLLDGIEIIGKTISSSAGKIITKVDKTVYGSISGCLGIA